MREDGADTKSGGTGLVTAGVVIVAVIAAGAYLSLGQNSPPSEEELATVVDPTASVPSDTVPAEDTGAETAPVEAEAAQPVAPSIDEVRLEADGLTVIAGRAAPGAEVSVLIDGQEVAKATADARGDFAAVGVVEPSDAARVLTLQATGEGGPVASNEDVILAPVPSPDPVQTAEADLGASSPVPGSEDTPGAATPVAPADATASDSGGSEPEAAPERDDGGQDNLVVAEAEPGVEREPEPASGAADPGASDTDEAVASAPAPATPAPAETESVEPAEETEDSVPTHSDQIAAAEIAEAPTDDAPAADTAAPEGGDQAEAAAPETGTQSVAVLKSTAEGVELLQTGPEVLSSIAIDTIGYSDTGDVQLSGRAVAGTSEVRVYLDNRFVAALPVDSAGTWRGNVPEVDAGIYQLRVDEVNEAGDVTSRLETPFKREAPAVLAEATVGPAGPVRAVTVQTGDTLWAIARDRYGEGLLYVKVFEANRGDIRDPDLIYPGQVFDLPVE